MLHFASRTIHGRSAVMRETLEAALQREIHNRREAQEELDNILRRNYILNDLLGDYEGLVPQLEAQNRQYEHEIQQSREQLRRERHRAEATDEYTRLLEQHVQDLERASTRTVLGASQREHDLRMELYAENLRAQEIEQTLHLVDERTRRVFLWQLEQLRAGYDANQALGQYTSESDQHLQHLAQSQEQSGRYAHAIQRSSATLANQGQYNLAGQFPGRQAYPREQRHSSITTDSDISMPDYIDSPDPMDVDDAATPNPAYSEYTCSVMREILRFIHWQAPAHQIERMLDSMMGAAAPRSEPQIRPFTPFNPIWDQYRGVAANRLTKSNASIPPRKKRTHVLDLDEAMNQDPNRRISLAEDPDLEAMMQRLRIDETKETPQTPQMPQIGPQRLFRPRISRWSPSKRSAGKKPQRPQKQWSPAPIRKSELPPLPLLTTAAGRQRLDARGRSLSLNDLPQLPSGQMPCIWPSCSPGDVDFVSQCQQAWRDLLNWFLQLLWEQPATVFVSVGVAVLAWVWHCHRLYEDWMTANEIPHGIASELRNARVSEIRWVEQLVYSFTRWMATDRAMLG